MIPPFLTLFLPLVDVPKVTQTDPNSWVVFAPSLLGQQIQEVPFQHIPTSQKGNFLFLSQSFPKQDEVFLRETKGILPLREHTSRNAQSQDSFALRAEDFVLCEKHCEKRVRERFQKNCRRENTLYAITAESRKLFLTNCPEFVTLYKPKGDPAVKFRLDTRTIWSSEQQYTFKKGNQMMVEDYRIKTLSGPWDTWITDSELYLLAKPNYFFPFHFTEDDIQSEVVAYQQGPLGTFAKLSFFLEVLLFKIRLDLTSAVGFFTNQIKIPLFLTVPLDGNRFSAASGFYFGFKSPLVQNFRQIKSSLPRLLARSMEQTPQQDHFVFLSDKNSCVNVKLRPANGAAREMPVPFLVRAAELRAIGYGKLKSDFGVYFPLSAFEKGEYQINIEFNGGDSPEVCELLAMQKESNSVRVREIFHD